MFSAAVILTSVLALVSHVSTAPAGHSGGSPLTLSLSGHNTWNGADGAIILATVTNVGQTTLNIVTDPNSVLSTLETDTFSIQTDNGAAPAFTGVIAKFVPGRARNFTVLQPGQSVTVSHTLGAAYDFTHSGATRYTVRNTGRFILSTSSGLVTVSASTSDHSAKLHGSLRGTPRHWHRYSRGNIQSRQSGTDTGCSADQLSQLTDASNAANSYVNGSLSYLQRHRRSTPRFKAWYGTWSAANYRTILSDYTALSAVNFDSGVSYDCSACTTPNTYAFTCETCYNQVWLCPYFWWADTTGEDSQAGTLIHEASHWNGTADTTDYAYGMDAAKTLASSTALNAVNNADSHEYFSENDPALT